MRVEFIQYLPDHLVGCRDHSIVRGDGAAQHIVGHVAQVETALEMPQGRMQPFVGEVGIVRQREIVRVVQIEVALRDHERPVRHQQAGEQRP